MLLSDEDPAHDIKREFETQGRMKFERRSANGGRLPNVAFLNAVLGLR